MGEPSPQPEYLKQIVKDQKLFPITFLLLNLFTECEIVLQSHVSEDDLWMTHWIFGVLDYRVDIEPPQLNLARE